MVGTYGAFEEGGVDGAAACPGEEGAARAISAAAMSRGLALKFNFGRAGSAVT